jgi:hypothetical protein
MIDSLVGFSSCITDDAVAARLLLLGRIVLRQGGEAKAEAAIRVARRLWTRITGL